ncbi:hypothetical protein RFI_18208 [Reticulomyxa filosa]|uniref:Uncharacterized protein n=1 Tax=Reticulomyxa filosa TaxID=46433 RepID=X6MZX2_RETFI|nr:hypothetical protein RFI_18208 [Reticulomyxa filosa]|eukprot:ETO19029.1 hypothetical protein RFI_18208 [Reticulomyxa filosa]
MLQIPRYEQNKFSKEAHGTTARVSPSKVIPLLRQMLFAECNLSIEYPMNIFTLNRIFRIRDMRTYLKEMKPILHRMLRYSSEHVIPMEQRVEVMAHYKNNSFAFANCKINDFKDIELICHYMLYYARQFMNEVNPLIHAAQVYDKEQTKHAQINSQIKTLTEQFENLQVQLSCATNYRYNQKFRQEENANGFDEKYIANEDNIVSLTNQIEQLSSQIEKLKDENIKIDKNTLSQFEEICCKHWNVNENGEYFLKFNDEILEICKILLFSRRGFYDEINFKI